MSEESEHGPTDAMTGIDAEATRLAERRRAANHACEDLFLQLRGAGVRAVTAHHSELSAHDAILDSLAARFATCARVAELGADVMLRQLQQALAPYVEAHPDHAADLLRAAVLDYYDLVA